MSDTDPAPTDLPAAPAGVTPGSADLVPDPVEAEALLPVAAGCVFCGHAPAAHLAGRCTIMLGDYGTEGPCPCPDMPAAAAPVAEPAP